MQRNAEVLGAGGPCVRGWHRSAAAGGVPGCGMQPTILDAGGISWQRCPASTRQGSTQALESSPHIASPSSPGYSLPIAFMFLTVWCSLQLLRYCKTGLSVLRTISQHQCVPAEAGPGSALSKQHVGVGRVRVLRGPPHPGRKRPSKGPDLISLHNMLHR